MEYSGLVVCKFIKNVIEGKTDVSKINQTSLVLIPKVLKLEYLYQFWPIGLCNVNFKILKKLLVNHLEFLIPKLISIN